LDKKFFTRPAVIVGTGRLASDIYNELSTRKDAQYRVAAFFGPKVEGLFDVNIPIYEDKAYLFLVAKDVKAERIIVALDDRRGKTPIRELLECRFKGIPVVQGISFYEELTGKILVERTNPAWLIFSDGFKKSKFTLFVKRCMDIVLSIVGLTISSPLIVFSAIIIILESKGPVFYRQDRVGLDEKVFKVIKFRSMVQDAEKDGKARWASEDDPRVTHYGRIMRKYRIDEIPQMWNVLKGEMSFVGPRPERPQFVEILKEKIPYYALRHSVKPGLTGWAQIFYPYGASSSEGRNLMASNLICWEVIRFGKKKGCKIFDLWGGLGPNADPNHPWYGFHRFKLGYGPELVEYIGSWDLIVSPWFYQLVHFGDKLRWQLLRLRRKLSF